MTGRTDIYVEIADQIASALERGVAPWRKPWRGRGGGLPSNPSTGRPYTGVNWAILMVAAWERGFSCVEYLTYKQAQAMGGQVRKGEKGTRILIMKPVTRKNPREGQDADYLMAKRATVFNLDQLDGLAIDEPESKIEPIAAAEQLVADYLASGPALRVGGSAYYTPAEDAITMPALGRFTTPAAYYSTLFHEIGHSTGHPSRLDRDLKVLGRDHSYAREELVAEFAAAFLRAHAGIVDGWEVEQSAAYLANWASKIRDDPKLLTWAASQGQRAADHVLSKRSAGGEDAAAA